MYMIFKDASLEQNCKPSLMQHGLCGAPTNSFTIISSEMDNVRGKSCFGHMDLATIKKVTNLGMNLFKYIWFLEYFVFMHIQLGKLCLDSSPSVFLGI